MPQKSEFHWVLLLGFPWWLVGRWGKATVRGLAAFRRLESQEQGGGKLTVLEKV